MEEEQIKAEKAMNDAEKARFWAASINWFKEKSYPETIDFLMKFGVFPVNCPLIQSIECFDQRSYGEDW